jgi:hypothetical protein
VTSKLNKSTYSTPAIEHPDARSAKTKYDDRASGLAPSAPVKVRFSIKAVVFILAIFSLSWVFESFRQIHQGATLSRMAFLLFSILMTTLWLSIHSYWIYIEEKSKGTLRRRIELFERIYAHYHKRAQIRASERMKDKDDADSG